MTTISNRRTEGEEEGGSKADRRSFIKGAAAAGLLGAAAITAALDTPAEGAQQGGAAEDPPRPAGIRPGGAFDCRFPIAYETSIPEATKVLMKYFASLSRRDLSGIAQTLHYPYGTYEGMEATIVESAENLMDAPPPSMNVTGKGENLI